MPICAPGRAVPTVQTLSDAGSCSVQESVFSEHLCSQQQSCKGSTQWTLELPEPSPRFIYLVGTHGVSCREHPFGAIWLEFSDDNQGMELAELQGKVDGLQASNAQLLNLVATSAEGQRQVFDQALGSLDLKLDLKLRPVLDELAAGRAKTDLKLDQMRKDLYDVKTRVKVLSGVGAALGAAVEAVFGIGAHHLS